MVGGYALLSAARSGTVVGPNELRLLAASAADLPITRLYIAFVSPTMTYAAGSNSLKGTGLGLASTGDFGFAELRSSVRALQTGGVEVFLSMGGWNFNCFSAMYARYSVGGYGTATPNYWKIQKYGHGSIDGCTPENQFCYVCEPPSQNTSAADFSIFPEPHNSTSFRTAVAYVEKGAPVGIKPSWSPAMVPGSHWTDVKTGQSLLVPGSGTFAAQGRDPYRDLVSLAKDLELDGVDLDYEEMWHADYFKVGPPTGGPWTLPQTVFKYAAIVKDLQLAVAELYPALKVSTAAAAVGAWGGKWWGGNLKGLWLNLHKWYPELSTFLTATGGINVMTYDLSKDERFHECPDESDCPLAKQVAFYMDTYATASIEAAVGFEIGTPAYPSPTEDPGNQLPLTTAALATIAAANLKPGGRGFLWELFKPKASACNADPTAVARAICLKVLPAGTARCNGTLPTIGPPSPAPPCPPSPSPPPPPSPSPSPSPTGHCHAIAGSGATDQWCQENCFHVPPNCPATLCKCTQ